MDARVCVKTFFNIIFLSSVVLIGNEVYQIANMNLKMKDKLFRFNNHIDVKSSFISSNNVFYNVLKQYVKMLIETDFLFYLAFTALWIFNVFIVIVIIILFKSRRFFKLGSI